VEPNAAFFDTLVGKRIAGRYLVDRLLGSGGMGIVASAKYPELGQKVAVKFLRPELANDARVSARFMREARVAAKVKSAHFVKVFDVGRLESGIPYLVMEMLTGRDLGDELRARGPFSLFDAIDCILQACTGVAEIHALGIVHRDLKPSNLFIANVAGSNMVKVLDFGISKEKPTESLAPLTATDHVLGTPQYMSPEQIKASKDVDPRSDIWAIGVILYELLTRALPFESEGGGVGEMFGKILYVDPELPSKHRSDLPEGFEAVLLKCMARERDERYASVLELAEALRPFASSTSLHRIDAIKQAAMTPAAEVDDDPILEVSGDEASRASSANTADSSPEAKRQLVLAPTALAIPKVDSSPVLPVPATAKTGPEEERAEAPRSRNVLLATVLGVIVVGAGAAGVMATWGGSTTATTTTSASGESANAEALASASASARAAALASAAPVDTGITVILPISASASASAATASRTRAGGPGAGSPRGAVRPPASTTPAAPVSAPALILDRK
jgi:serine/threonine-protein kinase